MTLALLAVAASGMAQTQFHNKEVNEVKGPVKSVTMKNWSKPIVTYITNQQLLIQTYKQYETT